MNKKTAFFCIILFVVTILLTHQEMNAQCAMCKSVVESNKANGGSISDGLNTAILYLMAVPYIALAIVGFLLYKNIKNRKLID